MASKAGKKTNVGAKTNKPDQLMVGVRPGESPDRAIARELMAPSVQAASTIHKLENTEYGIQGFVDELRNQIDSVHSGDMKRAEALLITQAHTLNELFNNLTRRAALNMGEYLNAAESYFRLALKAQSQCRATLETLSTIKNPPIVYAKQANIAQGHQQVHNGATFNKDATRARENENPPNELLEAKHGERLDFGTTGTAGEDDPAMATLGEIDGAKNGKR